MKEPSRHFQSNTLLYACKWSRSHSFVTRREKIKVNGERCKVLQGQAANQIKTNGLWGTKKKIQIPSLSSALSHWCLPLVFLFPALCRSEEDHPSKSKGSKGNLPRFSPLFLIYLPLQPTPPFVPSASSAPLSSSPSPY